MVCELTGAINVVQMKDFDCGELSLIAEEETAVIELSGAKAQVGGSLKLLDEFSVETSELDIDEARIVIGIGRGVGDRNGLKMIERLGGLIGATIGGTRPSYDAKYIPIERLIGQSGCIITPDLYIAIGVSGAVQHISGVKRAKIIAINHDPQAPIMRSADLGIVADYRQIIPLMWLLLEQARRVQLRPCC